MHFVMKSSELYKLMCLTMFITINNCLVSFSPFMTSKEQNEIEFNLWLKGKYNDEMQIPGNYTLHTDFQA